MIFETLWDDKLDIELNSASTQLFTKARRKDAINEAMQEFSDQTECFIRQSSVTCSCNVSEYALLSSGTIGGSTDFVRLAKQGLEYLRTDSNGATWQSAGDDFVERPVHYRNRFDPHWRESTTPTQTPTGYYFRPDGGMLFLGLSEPPDIGSSESAEVRVPYVALPAPMTSSGEEPYAINSTVRTDLRPYHQALVHFAAFRLLPLKGLMQEAQTQFALFQSYVMRYHQAQRPRGGQHVVFARNYFDDARSQRDADRPVISNRGYTWR